jgi:hypothetical protein
MGVFDGFRNMFNIRKERRRPPKGPKPKMGARIYLHDVRMAIQPGLSDELWDWLQELGFREITYSPDRRRYRDLPRSKVTELYDAPREEWRPILKVAIRESSKRPAVNASSRPVRAASSS